jgi:predicted outer membrane protein
MTEVLRKMLVAGAAVAALSVAACGQPAEEAVDTNAEAAATETVTNDVAPVTNEVATNEVATNEVATNDAAATNTTAE